MDDPKGRTEEDRVHFQEMYANSGLWSCCGYDGLSLVFDLPLEDLRSLAELQKQALMRLLAHLAKIEDESLLGRIRALEKLTIEERLTGLMQLSARFVP
jgi:hypothetical protein